MSALLGCLHPSHSKLVVEAICSDVGLEILQCLQEAVVGNPDQGQVEPAHLYCLSDCWFSFRVLQPCWTIKNYSEGVCFWKEKSSLTTTRSLSEPFCNSKYRCMLLFTSFVSNTHFWNFKLINPGQHTKTLSHIMYHNVGNPQPLWIITIRRNFPPFPPSPSPQPLLHPPAFPALFWAWTSRQWGQGASHDTGHGPWWMVVLDGVFFHGLI